MREILFRGKRTDNGEGEFVYGIPVEGEPLLGMGKRTYIITKPGVQWVDGVYMTYDECIGVDPETVCQFTGLYDKNGRKIFEGDIVEGNSEYFTYTHPYGKVVYDGGQYLISFDDVLEDIECLGAWANDVEIIGNIYDNPELLEVKQNG